jgi:7-cyano-7-deazaguanine synthase
MLLTVATAAAVGRGLTDVVFGGCLEDAEGFPDCRPAFVEAAQDCMRLAFAEPRLTIHAPLLKLTKVETVSLARELGDDCWRALGKTWSCYAPVRGANNSRDWVRCGECPACIKRARGFAAAGEKDPAPREMKA